MPLRLGQELKAARAVRRRSLQDVAGAARISVAYLQKLETGSVHTPSPHVLRRLAGALGLGYRRLMELAGYLGPGEDELHGQPIVPAPADLTTDEWRAVAAFVRYLREQRPR